MNQIVYTSEYQEWFDDLADRKAQARIVVRLQRIENGQFGDCQPVGMGVFELRIHYGPGYRIYFIPLGKELIILLAGGDKSTQHKDVKAAITRSKSYRN